MLDSEVPKVLRVEPLGKRVAVSPLASLSGVWGSEYLLALAVSSKRSAWNNFR